MAIKSSKLSTQLKTAKANQLKQEAKSNVTISKRVAGVDEVLQAGNPLEHTFKHAPYEHSRFGMNIGNTLNMDNYESLRVDVWLTDEVQKDETPEEAFSRVQALLEKVLEEVCLPYRQ